MKTIMEALGGKKGQTIMEVLGGKKGQTIAQVIEDTGLTPAEQDEEEPVKYTISYNANGGEGTIDSVEVVAGESVTLSDGAGLTAPLGKEFKGWAKSSSAQNPTVTSPFTPEANTTLYAVWGDPVQVAQ